MAPEIDDIRDVFDTTESDTAITTCIEMATDLVDDRLGDDAESLGTEQRNRLETLIACHFLAAGDPTAMSGGLGDESHEFERLSSTNAYDLLETRYGRRAVTYDPTGLLLEIPVDDGDETADSGDDMIEFFGV